MNVWCCLSHLHAPCMPRVKESPWTVSMPRCQQLLTILMTGPLPHPRFPWGVSSSTPCPSAPARLGDHKTRLTRAVSNISPADCNSDSRLLNIRPVITQVKAAPLSLSNIKRWKIHKELQEPRVVEMLPCDDGIFTETSARLTFSMRLCWHARPFITVPTRAKADQFWHCVVVTAATTLKRTRQTKNPTLWTITEAYNGEIQSFQLKSNTRHYLQLHGYMIFLYTMCFCLFIFL